MPETEPQHHFEERGQDCQGHEEALDHGNGLLLDLGGGAAAGFQLAGNVIQREREQEAGEQEEAGEGGGYLH